MAQLDFTIFRGLADSKWSGIKGAFPKCVGLNIHDTPGIIKVNQKLTKDSSTTITELCKVALALSTGVKLWFSSASGKIWAESGGTYTLVYTVSPAAGEAKILGASEFNAFVYFATELRLHRIPIASATTTASDWTTNAVPNWQTFNSGNASYHPMKVQNQQLNIGDANDIATVDSSATFTASAMDILAPNVIKTLAPFDIDLIIGTEIASTVNVCWVIRWDTVQTTWQFAEPIEENGINAFFRSGTSLLAQAGRYGNIYYFDPSSNTLQPLKRIPGDWSPSKYASVNPNAVGNFKGVAVFGLSNGTGNPADQGIYTLGKYSKDYPLVINGPEYVISPDAVNGVEIGAILVSGEDMYCSWNDGTNKGVDKVDTANKYASAYLEFPVVMASTTEFNNLVQFIASYASLPSGTSFTFKYRANYGTLTTISSSNVKNDTNANQVIANESIEARAFELRIEFNVSSNDAPECDMFSIISQADH